jgi:two-component sensor histidine kinase
VNELVSNAIAHGFRERESGTISISASSSLDSIAIQVVNDGARVPEGLTAATSRGLGLRIVERLAQYDLGGSFSIKPTSAGTVAEIVFPAAKLDPSHPDPRVPLSSSESAAL